MGPLLCVDGNLIILTIGILGLFSTPISGALLTTHYHWIRPILMAGVSARQVDLLGYMWLINFSFIAIPDCVGFVIWGIKTLRRQKGRIPDRLITPSRYINNDRLAVLEIYLFNLRPSSYIYLSPRLTLHPGNSLTKWLPKSASQESEPQHI